MHFKFLRLRANQYTRAGIVFYDLLGLLGQRFNSKKHRDGFQYRIYALCHWCDYAYIVLVCPSLRLLDKSGKWPHEMIYISWKFQVIMGRSHTPSTCTIFNTEWTHSKLEDLCRTNKATPLNSTDLCTTWEAIIHCTLEYRHYDIHCSLYM